MPRLLSSRAHPAAVAIVVTLASAPGAALPQTCPRFHLIGDVHATAVAGRAVGKPAPLGDPESEDHALYEVVSKETAWTSNVPCVVSVSNRSLNEYSDTNETTVDRCGDKKAESPSAAQFNSGLSSPWITGIALCMNHDRVKGWRIYGKRLDGAGNLVSPDTWESSPKRPNCHEGDWEKPVSCAEGEVATGADVYFSEGDEPRSWTGIRLRCRALHLPVKMPPPHPYDTRAGLKSYAHENPGTRGFATAVDPDTPRQFDWTVPPAFARCAAAHDCAPRSFPMVVLLHGFGQDKAAARKWAIGFNDVHREAGDPSDEQPQGYEKKPVFFVYPDGRVTDSGELGWKTPGLDSSKAVFPPGCTSVETQGVAFPLTCKQSFDDVQFVSDVIDHLMSNPSYAGAIDRDRVYLFGFSNGGQLTLASLCAHSSRYRAFAAVGIPMNPAQADVCGDPSALLPGSAQSSTEPYGIASPPHRTRPVLTINGTKDCHSPTDQVDATTSLLVQLNGAGRSEAARQAGVQAGGGSTTSEQITTWFGNAPNASDVKHYTIVNGDHSVPSYQPGGHTACPDTGPCAHDSSFSGFTAAWTFWNETAGLGVP